MTATAFPRYPRRRKRMHPLKAVLVILAVLATLVGLEWLSSWLVVTVIGWFGPKLAIWQGFLVILAFHVLIPSRGTAK